MAPDWKRVREILRNNRGLKIAAVIVSVVLWYAIRDATSFQMLVQDVRFDVRLDPGWGVLDRSVDEVDVLFRGSPGDIRYLTKEQVEIEIDLRGESQSGSQDVRISPRNVRSPRGTRPISVEPAEITLTLDREGESNVAVRADIVGAPPEGFEVESVICTPPQVRLFGPRGRIAGIQELKTGPIDLEGRLRSFTLTKTVMLPSETWSSRVEPDRVRVDVALVERSTRREIEGIGVSLVVRPDTPPIHVKGPPMVKVVVKGRSEILATLSPTNLTAFVDCSRLLPGETLSLPVFAPVPSGVEVVEVVPPSVPVEMSPQPAEGGSTNGLSVILVPETEPQ